MASGNPNNRNNNDFNLDKQEYHSVFNFFDKNKKGEINIGEVYELIQKFDEKTNPAPQKKKRKEISGGRMSSDQQQNITNNLHQGSSSHHHHNHHLYQNKNSASKHHNQYFRHSPTKRQNQAQHNHPQNGGLHLKPNSIETGNKSPRQNQSNSNNFSSKQESKNMPSIGGGIDTTGKGNGKAGNSEQNQIESGGGSANDQSNTQQQLSFPNGRQTLKFDEFIDIIEDSCRDQDQAENYLVYAFSMFDRKKKGYINTEDLKEVFKLLGEGVSEEEVNTMIKIAGVKSNDKINFKEFVDFFYKLD